MRLALRELRRAPRRFVATTAALALIVVLLLLLGGLSDGLYLGSTGALRAQRADLVVFSAEARDSAIRSRIDAEVREQVAAADGVVDTHGFGVALVGARVPGRSELADAAVLGYEGAVSGVPDPPPPGEAWADRRLEADGVEPGQTLLLGPAQVPVVVAGWVSDTSYLLQGGLWVEPGTWREVLSRSRPDAALAGGTFQTVMVEVEGDPDVVAARIDTQTGGATRTLTVDEAVLALPGVEAQNSTFRQIVGVTFLVAGLVVALFFALLTLERIGLYGVLKAVGASTSQLAVGLLIQAVAVSAVAYLLGAAVSLGVAAITPPDIPLRLTGSRAVFVAVGVVVTAGLGGALSLRRVARVDPASAIGTAG